jgi:Predicted transcriptional regulators
MLGDRIRDLRKEKKLTMHELAERIGITQGHLSQVERDIIEPSLSVIRKIAAELGVSLASLFAEYSNDGVSCITPDQRKTLKYKGENVVYEFLTPTPRNSNIIPKTEMILFRLNPRSWASDEIMIHTADECLYVIEGTIEYHIKDTVYRVEKDNSIYIPENTPHRLYNPSDEVTLAIAAITPPVY